PPFKYKNSTTTLDIHFPYTTLFRSAGVRISSHRYAVFSPFGLGGLPAPWLWPLLKGKKRVVLPSSLVVNSTSESSTAKWTRHRLVRKRTRLNSSHVKNWNAVY